MRSLVHEPLVSIVAPDSAITRDEDWSVWSKSTDFWSNNVPFLGAIESRTPRANLRRIGGADRDRTGGLLVANEALSQLSYSPT